MNRQKKSPLSLFILACITGLIVLGTSLNISNSFLAAPSFAQSARPQEFGMQVYQRLPNLPLENKYVSKDTKKVAADNTLVTRLLQYHIYLKGRAPGYRLDWKLTLADYLGANELINEAAYPGNVTLLKNPLEGDRAVITSLNRKQRNELVQVIVSLFNQNTRAVTSPSNRSEPQIPASPTSTPLPPRPGDAQRLK